MRLEVFDDEQAAGMRTRPHSGFHVHTAVWVPEEDRAFATRLACDCARNPVAPERRTSERAATAVTYRSAKSEGPTAGTETVDPLEFLARVLVHIPDNGQSPRATTAGTPTEASRRWAALLQQIFVVDPVACPSCHGPLSITPAPTTRGDVRRARRPRLG